jgi:enolase-phosphatase E1
VVLLDIEGTTTPIRFVYEVLFPLARRRLAGFLSGLPDPELESVAEAVRREREHEAEPMAPRWNPQDPRASSEAYLLWLMDRDRKSTALKSVQGRIWQRGFESGELRGEVYPDVPPALERWVGEGRRVAIFSSGSVLAQRLLFAHTTAGDLTSYLSGHFDTGTGAKREAASYRRIAAELGASCGALLFVSDVVAELDAARGAGLRTALCVRSDEPPGGGGGHAVVRDFDALP